MKLDILAFAAHPDDVEMSCGGTLYKMSKLGKKTGIIDLTRGELGTRGTPELRAEEAANAAKILGLAVRENLGFRDGFFLEDEAHSLEIIRKIRQYQPEIVLANAPQDRHPDHGKGSRLVRNAAYLAGLRKIETEWEGKKQEPWRPKKVYFYIQDYQLVPDFMVQLEEEDFQRKIDAIKAYKSQFFDPNSKEPYTFISTDHYWDALQSRFKVYGQRAGVPYAEGFLTEQPVMVQDLFVLG